MRMDAHRYKEGSMDATTTETTPAVDMQAAEQAEVATELRQRAAAIDLMSVIELGETIRKKGMDWFDPALGLLKTETLGRLFAVLDKARKTFEALGTSAGEDSAKVESELLPRMRESGMQSMKVAGTTVYVERKLWGSAKDGNAPLLCAALKEMGHGDMVKEGVNGQTFSAYIREIEEQVSKTPLSPNDLIPKLPELLQPVVQIAEVFKIRARKG